MNTHIRWFLPVMLAIIPYWQSAASASVITNNNLEISVSVFSDTIAQCLPAVVTFRVKNVSSEAIQILRPSLGSMEVAESAQASIALSIKGPSQKNEHIHYAKPFIGPVREVEYVKVSPVILAPNQELISQLVIGGSWSTGRGYPLFTQDGQYSVSLAYYPFALTNTAGRLQIDYARAEVTSFLIAVSKRDSDDEAAWQQIQRLKHWWILYDPEMRNVEYLSDTEQQELGNELTALAQDHGKSSYRQYLEYAAVALQSIGAKRVGAVASDAVMTLDSLANDQGFAYHSFAQEMRNKIKQ